MSSEPLSEPQGAEVKIFLLSTISLSVAVWDIAFNYGVFNTVFFDKVFTVWAASSAALLASLFVPPPPDRRYLISWRGRFILLLPTLWIGILLLAGEPLAGEPTDIVLTGLSIAVGLVTLPYTLYVLIIILTPDLINLRNPRYVAAMLLIVALIGVTGFAVGRQNDLFLTCEDFVVSGSDSPPRCKS